MSSLQGKAIVVTGSGRGIGAGIAKLAASEGASVVVTDIDKALGEAHEVLANLRAKAKKFVFFSAGWSARC